VARPRFPAPVEEQVYFDGAHFAHVVAWNERQRLNRKRIDAARLIGRR
jgi:hypothetical protein